MNFQEKKQYLYKYMEEAGITKFAVVQGQHFDNSLERLFNNTAKTLIWQSNNRNNMFLTAVTPVGNFNITFLGELLYCRGDYQLMIWEDPLIRNNIDNLREAQNAAQVFYQNLKDSM